MTEKNTAVFAVTNVHKKEGSPMNKDYQYQFEAVAIAKDLSTSPEVIRYIKPRLIRDGGKIEAQIRAIDGHISRNIRGADQIRKTIVSRIKEAPRNEDLLKRLNTDLRLTVKKGAFYQEIRIFLSGMNTEKLKRIFANEVRRESEKDQ